jgi:hypothetical protein
VVRPLSRHALKAPDLEAGIPGPRQQRRRIVCAWRAEEARMQVPEPVLLGRTARRLVRVNGRRMQFVDREVIEDVEDLAESM